MKDILDELKHLQIILNDLRVDAGNSVDSMTAHNAQIGHIHSLLAVFLNKGHPPHPVQITRPTLLHFLKVEEVDLVDDVQVTGQNVLEQAYRPTLQSFRKNLRTILEKQTQKRNKLTVWLV